MAKTFSSVTFYCLHDCGTSITFHRDDHLPTAPWECEACLDAAIKEQLKALPPFDFDRPIYRVGFDGFKTQRES